MRIAIYTTCASLFGRLCQAWKNELESSGDEVHYISLPRGYKDPLPQPPGIDVNLYMGGVSMFWPLVESGFPPRGRHVLWLFEPLKDKDRPDKAKLFASTKDCFDAIISMNTENKDVIQEYLPQTPSVVIPTTVHKSQIQTPRNDQDRNIDVLQLGHGSKRRKLAEQLFASAGVQASFVYGGYYNSSKYDLMAGARISLQIHRYADAYFSHHRIIEAISVGSVIVTEPSPDMHEYGFEDKKHLVVAELDEMPNTCRALLKSKRKRNELIKNAQDLLRNRFTTTYWQNEMNSVLEAKPSRE
ncbi:MAG: glycosyltransferase family 1 protein [Phycisphaerales bacterium]|nr:MAG: glycosyltransferase family 1 protein [Phycisphaerales bacterium]